MQYLSMWSLRWCSRPGDASQLVSRSENICADRQEDKADNAANCKALNISVTIEHSVSRRIIILKRVECNLRASRSFPFVSKVLKINLIELATKVMLGIKVEKPEKSAFELDYVGIKAPQFSFTRLQKADLVLGVDMASTGISGGYRCHFDDALLTSMFAVGYRISKNIMISSGGTKSKVALLEACRCI